MTWSRSQVLFVVMAPARRRPKSLAAGRPKSVQSTKQLSSRASRRLINEYHSVSKALAHATANNDSTLVTTLQARLNAQGGLSRYQEASKAGQSADRGGDSSRVLVEWLVPVIKAREYGNDAIAKHPQLRMLEVGALAVDNACARSGLFDMTRIDLNSQNSQILKQDFMERHLPQSDQERFDCISLSLVVNYCPDARGRGEMLKRAVDFLVRPDSRVVDDVRSSESCRQSSCFPSVFLVLPAACVTNSRHLNEERLVAIMVSLGFVRTFRKMSGKLVYYLWVLCNEAVQRRKFPKTEVNRGRARNNFAIVLE